MALRSSDRLSRLARHVVGGGGAGGGAGAVSRQATLGEDRHAAQGGGNKHAGTKLEQAMSKATLRFRYQRKPIKIVVFEKGGGGAGQDTYGGFEGVMVLEGEQIIPSNTSQAVESTVVVIMHPTGVMNMLPMPIALARAGVHVVTCASRYPHNDSTLIMEKVLKDLGSVVNYCREELGYDRVVLGGWSGGGSLSATYQRFAECDPKSRPTTPVDLTTAVMPAADGVLILAAHSSRARILTEWLDPSIYMLRRGDHPDEEAKLRSLDLYTPPKDGGAPSPPYSADFLRRFRAAQLARSRRITAWVKQELKRRQAAGSSLEDARSACFVVDGTMADPRWLDLSVEPNDRPRVGHCFLGDPRVANMSPTGLARFTTLASWLSQWSVDESIVDGITGLAGIRVPVLVIENSRDDAVPPSHLRNMFKACASKDKSYILIRGANHYYDGQRHKIVEACRAIIEWMNKRGLVDIALPNASGPPVTAGGTVAATPTKNLPDVAALRAKYGRPQRNGMQLAGINHLALTSSDMARTCDFMCGVLGLRLSKTIALPDGAQHFFFDVGLEGSALAYFWFKDSPPPAPGVSTPDLKKAALTGRLETSAGAMNHVAFNVPEERIEEYRERLEDSPLCPWVSPVVYHADTPSGFARRRSHPAVSWVSVYFFGPDGEMLELTSQTHDFADPEREIQLLPQLGLHRDWVVGWPASRPSKHHKPA